MKKLLVLLFAPISLLAQSDTSRVSASDFLLGQVQNYDIAVRSIKEDALKKIRQVEQSYNHDLILAISQQGIKVDSTTQFFIRGREIIVINKKAKK